MTSIYEIHKANRIGRANDFWTALVAQKWRASEEEFKEYTGSVPITINANGSPLISWRISGNTVQTGTPTPQNPVMPEGCGERTGNLMVFDTDSYIGGVNFNVTPEKGTAQFVINKVQTGSAQSCTIPLSIPLKQGTYTLSVNGIINRDGSYDRIYIRDEGGVIANYVQEGTPKTFTLANDTTITALSIPCGATSTYDNITVKVMLNSGSTSLPYEPYGYKIPISSASTTTPVYLGEVESTRRIKKYVFTGEENGAVYSTGTSRKGIGITGIIGGNADVAILAICTHYQPYTRNTLYRNTDNGMSNAYQNDKIIFYDASCQTVEAFQQFCAQQYAAGTPVTVWYVLANPETAVVNEPLMKIGDYADEVSNVATMPTNNGSTTIDVLTELKPSEIYIKYKGR